MRICVQPNRERRPRASTLPLKKIGASVAVAALAAIVIGAAAAGPGRGRVHSHGGPRVAASVRGPLFLLPNAKLGDRRVRTVKIRNKGKTTGLVRLTARVRGSRAFAAQVRIRVDSIGPRGRRKKLYSGPLTNLRRAKIGRLAPRARKKLRIEMALVPTGSQAADNRLAGQTVKAALVWIARQA